MSGTSATVTAGPIEALHLGSGTPLLLLHGLLLSPHCWESTAVRLAARCEVFAPALAGHWGGPVIAGDRYSTAALADRVEAQLDDLGWRTCHIAGHSLGGWVGFELARRGRARTLTAIAPAGGWRSPSAAQVYAAGKFRALNRVADIGRRLGDFPANSRIVRRVVAQLLTKEAKAVTREDLVAQIHAILHCCAPRPVITGVLSGPGPAGLAEPGIPVRLILTDSDRIFPAPIYGRRFLRRLPESADRILLRRAGHMPMLENPERTANLIAEHIFASRGQLRAV